MGIEANTSLLEDRDDGKYIGVAVDASDIFHCNL
jgi:hypothetical protein